jgi:hypothetical protein
MQDIRFKLITEKTDTEGKAPVYLFYNRNGEPLQQIPVSVLHQRKSQAQRLGRGEDALQA